MIREVITQLCSTSSLLDQAQRKPIIGWPTLAQCRTQFSIIRLAHTHSTHGPRDTGRWPAMWRAGFTSVLQSEEGLQSLLWYTLGVWNSGKLLNKLVPPKNESTYYQRMLSWVDISLPVSLCLACASEALFYYWRIQNMKTSCWKSERKGNLELCPTAILSLWC